MSLIHNEQTKLTATAVNTVAVAFFIAGFVGPAVAVGYGSDAMPKDAVAIAASLVWLFVGFTLHLIGKLVLTGLKP